MDVKIDSLHSNRGKTRELFGSLDKGTLDKI